MELEHYCGGHFRNYLGTSLAVIPSLTIDQYLSIFRDYDLVVDIDLIAIRRVPWQTPI
jgi:hypothetical protein